MIEQFPDLVGRTFQRVYVEYNKERMVFEDETGPAFHFYHEQDCCERVAVEDVIGDLSDLEGSPILTAEAISSEGAPHVGGEDSFTWTFYRFATVKGVVTVRWLGQSNGYYSESVSFGRVHQ